MNVFSKGHHVRGLALFFAFFLPALTLANEVIAATSIDTTASDTIVFDGKLAQDWLTANYYHKSGTDQFTSEIVNDDFFVSESGRTNPVAEFNTFIQMVLAHHANGENEDLLCRFPARISLLERHKLLPKSWQKPACSEYEEIVRPEQLRSLSLVFASGYFNNPASYYGHTIIKFNYAGVENVRSVLDRSLNYGADVQDDPSTPRYLIRGLFGGYTGSYARNNYYLYSHLYTNSQLRDIWEYELILSDEEVKFITEHSWEMKDAKFPYFFFNDNCAHRIARLIELATNLDMTDTHGFWLLPIQVIRNLEGNEDRGSLIMSPSYTPSLKTQFAASFVALDQPMRKEFVDYFRQADEEKRALVTQSPTNLLLLKLNYLDLEIAKRTIEEEGEESSIPLNEQRATILQELFRRPPSPRTELASVATEPIPPLETKPPSQLRFGYGNRNGSNYQTLGYRVADHDLLNSPSAGQEISTLIMGELEIERGDDATRVRKVVFFNVTNINTNPLPVWMTKERSWSLSLDYSPRSRACLNCSDFGLEGRTGRANRINPRFMIYGFAGARLHTSTSLYDNIFTVTAELGTLINIGDLAVVGIRGKAYSDVSSGETDWVSSLELAINPKSRFDVRVGYERQGSDDVTQISAAYYFD